MGNLKTFNWMNCGGMAGGVVSASVSPDPIKTGDNVMIGADVSINMTLASPLKVFFFLFFFFIFKTGVCCVY